MATTWASKDSGSPDLSNGDAERRLQSASNATIKPSAPVDPSNEIDCVAFDQASSTRWDEFVAKALGGTTLHSRRFLSYHGDRFVDQSVMLINRASKQIVAVMPAAVSLKDRSMIVSHPGATFGGLLLTKIDVAQYANWFDLVRRYYRSLGFATLRSKTTPSFVGALWNEVPTHYGLQFGKLVRADLWNVIRLDTEFKFASTRRSDIKTAVRKGVNTRLAVTQRDWEDFYELLAANLKDRHGAVPVHSVAELMDLHGRLENRSRLLLCFDTDQKLLAGTWLLDYGHHVLHTQYICSNETGRALHAVDVLLRDAIELAKSEAYRVFSFGINTQDDGWSINHDLMKYKLRFGSGVITHMTFDYTLDA